LCNVKGFMVPRPQLYGGLLPTHPFVLQRLSSGISRCKGSKHAGAGAAQLPHRKSLLPKELGNACLFIPNAVETALAVPLRNELHHLAYAARDPLADRLR
jgi:hypothetical protein